MRPGIRPHAVDVAGGSAVWVIKKGREGTRQGVAWLLCVAASVGLSGCCRKEYAGVVVLNDTGAPLWVKVAGSEYEPWEVGAGQDVIIPGPEGPSALQARPAQDPAAKPEERQVALRLDRLTLVAYPSANCYAVVDHTDQYEGQGALKVLAKTGPELVGELESLPLQGVTYLHPDQKLPPDILQGDRVVRFTRVPCGLLPEAQAEALREHLEGLD
jgi:hypothetical protein